MMWNWQQNNWPHFSYEAEKLNQKENEFSFNAGQSFGIFISLGNTDQKHINIQLLESEAYTTSEIEGEILNRDSIQNSIFYHFNLPHFLPHDTPKEYGIASLLIDNYQNYQQPLTKERLCKWHKLIIHNNPNSIFQIQTIGDYRIGTQPMQIQSGHLHNPTIHFEAPPSAQVPQEMKNFIDWFNDSAPDGSNPLPALTRASIAHLYYESIHPFEDGNGRIGRALVEKSLAQNLRQPTLIGLSNVIQNHKKQYYQAFENSQTHNNIDKWLDFFSNIILKAQAETIATIQFIARKNNFFIHYHNQLNLRQKKVIERIFKTGINGFKGGLSAKNYQVIAKTPPATATRDLQDLVQKGILTRTGLRKSTRYYLNLELREKPREPQKILYKKLHDFDNNDMMDKN
ncbi:MAG: Fic family protein [Alphaproteobacteria bacterium]|nr:Fic family protein [Alphaproteobacteria bacterium]